LINSVKLFFYNLWNRWSYFKSCKVDNKLTKFFKRGDHKVDDLLNFLKLSKDIKFLKILNNKKNVIFLDSSDDSESDPDIKDFALNTMSLEITKGRRKNERGKKYENVIDQDIRKSRIKRQLAMHLKDVGKKIKV
jgi:hypothetical protein